MSRDAMKLALEALDCIYSPLHVREINKVGAAMAALREALAEQPAQQALDKMAENARELGLDYEPSSGTQVNKVWWDGEKMMARQVPLEDFYKPAQRTWVGLTDEEIEAEFGFIDELMRHCCYRIETKLREKNNG